ncbi:MAG: gluconate 2-dehydrogenase subunit 3 family protein [Candidatus Binatia bacterium]
MRISITRREFLRASGAGVTLGALPGFLRFPRGEGVALAATSTGVLFPVDSLEYRTIDAAVSRLIPDDQDPGAGPARVVDYVNRFVGAFEGLAPGEVPFLFAGGPFSDRNPDRTEACGTTSIPPGGQNHFATPVPLSRTRELAWRVRILGTAAIPDPAGTFLRDNNKLQGIGDADGNTPGLRQLYVDGVRELNDFATENFGASYPELDPVSQELALDFFPNQDFVGLLWEHTVEGMYANPEYGGNQPPDLTGPASGADGDNRPLGWRAVGFEGDRQPLGYTIFDEASGEYCELPGHPVSTPDVGPDRAALTAAVLDLLPTVILCVEINGRRLCLRT